MVLPLLAHSYTHMLHLILQSFYLRPASATSVTSRGHTTPENMCPAACILPNRSRRNWGSDCVLCSQLTWWKARPKTSRLKCRPSSGVLHKSTVIETATTTKEAVATTGSYNKREAKEKPSESRIQPEAHCSSQPSPNNQARAGHRKLKDNLDQTNDLNESDMDKEHRVFWETDSFHYNVCSALCSVFSLRGNHRVCSVAYCKALNLIWLNKQLLAMNSQNNWTNSCRNEQQSIIPEDESWRSL